MTKPSRPKTARRSRYDAIRSAMMDPAQAQRPATLDRAIRVLRLEVPRLPESRRRREAEQMLAFALTTRYTCTNQISDLEEALSLLRPTASAYLTDAVGRGQFFFTLGIVLLNMYDRTGGPALLTEAETSLRDAVRELRDARCLIALGTVLQRRFESTSDAYLLAEAADVIRRAVGLAENPDDWATYLAELGAVLDVAGRVNGDVIAHEEAVQCFRKATQALSTSNPRAGHIWFGLSGVLLSAYDRSGTETLLAEAIAAARRSFELTGPEHTERAPCLQALGNALLTRFEREGDRGALAEAIDHYRGALTLTEDSHLARPRYQANLAGALLRRFEFSDDVESLNEAVGLLRDAVERTPQKHVSGPSRSNLLAAALGRRAQLDPDLHLADLEEAVEILRELVRTTPSTDQHAPMHQSNLGAFLTSSYELVEQRDALDEAIETHRAAVVATSIEHSEYGKRLGNLGVALALRANETGDLAFAEEAESVCLDALERLAPSEPTRAAFLNVTARAAECAHNHADGDSEDSAARRALGYYRTAAKEPTAPATDRILAAQRAAKLAARLHDAKVAAGAFRDAVRLLDRVVSLALGHQDQERLLAQLTELPGDAAALAIELGRPREAVELLEQGRALLLGRALQSRDDRELQEYEPELAQRLRHVEQLLDRAQAPGSSLALGQTFSLGGARSMADDRADLAAEHALLLQAVRSRPGLERFRRPPKFAELCEAAAQGPVVMVNISGYRCDALIVSEDDVRIVPLGQVTLDEVASRAKTFVDVTNDIDGDEVDRILGWLWDTISAPVLGALSITGPARPDELPPRIWWCPTGLATALPLHVAGDHLTNGDDGFRSVLDWTIPSYTPTLRALTASRQPTPEALVPQQFTNMLAIGVSDSPAAPGQHLEEVDSEIAAISQLFPGATALVGQDATGRTVLDQASRHRWLHLACHGKAGHPSPFDGYLCLADGKLTARSIAAKRLPHADLAFACACETFRSSARLPDEAITIASVLNLAGYRHVIATQWPVSEMFTGNTTQSFYRHSIRRDENGKATELIEPAASLRAAMIESRSQQSSKYTSGAAFWAAFIHVGP